MVIDQRQRSKAFLARLGEMYTAKLQRAKRGVLRGLEADGRRPSEEPRHSGVFSVNARLTPRSFELVRKRLLELGELIEAKDDPHGEATIVTIVFHPEAQGGRES